MSNFQLVAESGSTKTDWCVFNPKNGQQYFFKTQGIHPFFSDKDEILNEIRKELPAIHSGEVEKIYFYGPGTTLESSKTKLKGWLSVVFSNAEIIVDTDLLAAGRAMFGKESGLVCILGTGSNSGLYENGVIAYSVPSLGYIFGDEGSGVHIGKLLIDEFLNDDLPPVVKDLFYKTYTIDINDIIANVYSKPFTNRYLAQFSQFIYENIHLTYCRSLVDFSFDCFFSKRIAKYSIKENTHVKFVGTIAYSFKDILTKVAMRHNVKLNPDIHIVKSPISGLVRFHFS